MTNILFAVLLSLNINVGDPFDNFDKGKTMLMYEKLGEEGVKQYREEFFELFVV